MTLECTEATISLGAYVVGALEHTERADLEAHLARCPMCRDELAELAPLPGLLSRLTVDEVLAGPPTLESADADGAMLDRLLAAAARERRGASRTRWFAAAAAVVLIAAGGTGAVVASRGSAGTHWQQTAAAAAGPVHLRVKLVDQANGTKLDMTMWGVHSGQRCSLVAVSRDGRKETAGWWDATYAGQAHITGTTSIARRDLAQLRVVTDAGKTLVTVAI